MSVIIAPNDVQTTLVWTGPYFDSGGGATVLGFRGTGAWGLTEIVSHNAIVAQAAEDVLLDRMTNQITLAEVRSVSTTIGSSLAVSTVGANNWQTPPSNVTALMTYNTSLRGRRARGRSYWPGMFQETEVDNLGILSGDAITRIGNGLSEFFADILAGPWASEQVILQHETPSTNPPANPTPPLSPAPEVANRQLQIKVATQRRRLRR